MYKMIDGVVLSMGVPRSGNRLPQELPVGELELRMQESFVTRNKWIKRGYFVEGDSSYPNNLSFFVHGRDKNKDNILVSGLVATLESVNCFDFTYYDKIFVIPGYRKNGLMLSMVDAAREVKEDNDKKRLPSVLRTSDPDLHEAYGKKSDTWLEIGGYFVHGFGFLNKDTKEELFEGAKEKFDIAANYVAIKPPTLVDAPLVYKLSPKIGIKIDHALICTNSKMHAYSTKFFGLINEIKNYLTSNRNLY